MAGFTDLPYRAVARQYGAGITTSEMLTSQTQLWKSRKSSQRLDIGNEPGPRSIQIVGNNPLQMAEAAKACEQAGADIIDINLGCPAKKVCNKAAGSALMRDELLVAAILSHVVEAVNCPVTLKMRTGWSKDETNAPNIAQIAEQVGIVSLAVHGRSRACKFNGNAEYDTIKLVKLAVNIPVFANGDIDTPHKAEQVLNQTGADGVLIGRAAVGNPWLIRDTVRLLAGNAAQPVPTLIEKVDVAYQHLLSLHEFYGDVMGPRIARKHIKAYFNSPSQARFLAEFNQLDNPQSQLKLLHGLPSFNIDKAA